MLIVNNSLLIRVLQQIKSYPMFPPEFNASLLAIIFAAAFFLGLLVWHVCKDYGLFNSHRRVGDRRQRHQKAVLNLQIAEKISICISPKVATAPVVLCVSEPDPNPGPPSFAFVKTKHLFY